jgi:hypothetical protein
MRIPVFTSRAQRPSDAPGRPITARMRAEPFIQAELRKGEVMTEALGQVQEYALMRHKAAVEVQMSESLLAAEEEMMNLANRLKDSTDIYNVFKPDGSGSWSDNVNDMRERLADSIESRSARDEFRARFNQSELSKRFQLKGAIDTRVQARANAAAAARMQAVEDALSNPAASVADYDLAVMGHSRRRRCGDQKRHCNAWHNWRDECEACRQHRHPHDAGLCLRRSGASLSLWPRRWICKMRWMLAPSRRKRRMSSLV